MVERDYYSAADRVIEADKRTLGWLLGFVGYWLAEWGHRIEAWAGIEPIKAGGTD